MLLDFAGWPRFMPGLAQVEVREATEVGSSVAEALAALAGEVERRRAATTLVAASGPAIGS